MSLPVQVTLLAAAVNVVAIRAHLYDLVATRGVEPLSTVAAWLDHHHNLAFGLLFFTFGSIVFTYRVLLYPFLLSPLRHLPKPKHNSLFMGNFRQILRDPSGSPQREWVDTVPNDGLIYYRTAFNAERIMPTNPETLREVLVTKSYDFVKPAEARYSLGRVLGFGILLVEGDEHRRQRRLLNPAFAFRHVKDLYPLFWAKAVEAADQIRQISSRTTEMHDWASRTTLDIIGEAGMGRDFQSVGDPENFLNKTYKKVISPGKIPRIILFLGLILPISWIVKIPFKRNRDVTSGAAVIKDVARDLIQEKKGRMEKIPEREDKDILSVAIESGGFSDEDLVSNCMTFLAAGHETTATAMTWALWLLCKHPEVQERLRAEVREHLPLASNEKTITASDIDRLPYLQAVCNEILRIYPPVPLTIRKAVKNTTLAGHHVPAGSTIILSPWAINTSSAMWGPNAREFQPERWLDARTGAANQSGGAESNFSFMTFLHGPRSCIGASFARAEFACLLAVWVGTFAFELADPNMKLVIKEGVTARPKDGVTVKFRVV